MDHTIPVDFLVLWHGWENYLFFIKIPSDLDDNPNLDVKF